MLRHIARPVQLKRSCRVATESIRRLLVTLAIETSCDDTAVAILESKSLRTAHDDASRQVKQVSNGATYSQDAVSPRANLWFNEKITANNAQYGGIHPIVALESHQRNLASLVQRALAVIQTKPAGQSNDVHLWRPDLIAVTRGPGMRSNLATGIDFAKGLSVAWGIPIIGVHHMQAHLLTPRMVTALETTALKETAANLDFPFLSLLVSGGHTMLLLSKSLNEHALMADTDLPLGQALDKLARVILPQHVLDAADSTMYGAALEKFAFPNAGSTAAHADEYTPPRNRAGRYYNQTAPSDNTYPWFLRVPLAEADGGAKRQSLEYSFAGTVSAVDRIMKFEQSTALPKGTPRADDVSIEERRHLAKEAMRVCFEHLASRVLLALDGQCGAVGTVVVSGGVASNHYLRVVLKRWLSAFGYSDVEVNCPPPKYCTDNAAMIAWAGYEMYEAGWRSNLGFTARRKWPLGLSADKKLSTDAKGQGEDGAVGVLDVDCWYNVLEQQGETDGAAQPWQRPTT